MHKHATSAPEPVPVLATTIIDDRSLDRGTVVPSTRILVVVRDPVSNLTHPDVVSMPTQRIPFALASSLLDEAEETAREIVDGCEITHVNAPEYSNTERMVHNPLIYAVVALLTRKLGVTEYLEWRGARQPRLTFAGAVTSVAAGYAKYTNKPRGEHREHIRMINVAVRVLDGAEAFPPSTSSYAYVRWVPVEDFMEAMRDRNPTAIDARLRLEQHCIHGLCVHAAYGSLTRAIAASEPVLTQAVATGRLGDERLS